MSVLSAFNKIVQDFLEDCMRIFPKDNDFKIYKKAIDLLVKYNPKKINTVFKEYIDIYRTQINNQDEQFFLENKFEEVEKYNNDEIFNVINKLKLYWKNLDNNNKEKIWKYLDVMIKLSDAYNNVAV